MIQRLTDLTRDAYNPIRPHIRIKFEKRPNVEAKIRYIAQHLAEKGFDPEKSRVLVFVRTRKGVENAAEELSKYLPKALENRVGFFHAGLGADEREQVISAFGPTKEEGREEEPGIAILCATKAFGMGMDIPNIHYVFHLGPSSTFEDFLQEIGRAGRNPKALEAVGLSAQNPIETVCLLKASDFGDLRDLIKSSQLSWNDVETVFADLIDLFAEYGAKIGKKDEKGKQESDGDTLPLSLSFYTQTKLFRDNPNNSIAQTNFRIVLHWLEQLGRIRLGYYLPANLTFDNQPLLQHQHTYSNEVSDPTLKRLLRTLLRRVDELQHKTSVNLWDLRRIPSVQKNSPDKQEETLSPDELFKAVALGHKGGYLRLDHSVSIALPSGRKTKGGIIPEFVWTATTKREITAHPALEILFQLAGQLLKLVAPDQQIRLEGEQVNNLVKEALDALYTCTNFPWLEPMQAKTEEEKQNEWEKNIEQQRKRFKNTGRGTYARGLNGVFALLRSMDGVKIRDEISDTGVHWSLWRSAKCTQQAVLDHFADLRRDTYRLLNYLFGKLHNATDGNSRFELAEALNLLSKPSIPYLEVLQNLLVKNYLVQFDGTLLPMAIELNILDGTAIDLKNEADQTIALNFGKTQKLRRIRLAVLAGFGEIETAQHNTYINEYFQCLDYDQIEQLLKNYLPLESTLLKELQEEALLREEAKLNEQQRAVYDARLTTNLNVVAGPGSGKTHTLILRVARLVHREGTPPAQILVLAYNRAVVVELKERLRALFNELGYNKLTASLKVFTFHGFIKYCLQEQLDGIDFKDYATKFIDVWNHQPGLINNRMGPVKQVFVDEFQDITNSRLEVLKIIANPAQERFVTVIGDPNQSIYGFDRISDGGEVSPISYYREFNRFFNAERLRLTTNYRSLPGIITTAQRMIDLNRIDNFQIPPLTAFHPVPDAWKGKAYVEETEARQRNWIDKTLALLDEKRPDDGKLYREIAVLFRSNEQLYRAFIDLRERLPKKTRLRIQGETEDFLRLREVYFALDEFIRPNANKPVTTDFLNEYRTWLTKTPIPPAWDGYLFQLIEACLIQFQTEKRETATYTDFEEFLRDIAQKDDGQLSKIYHQNAKEIKEYSDQTTLVMTTMHKVKGLEFDAVVLPPSYALLPYRKPNDPPFVPDSPAFIERIEEERRLWFVALSRAKFRLMYFPWEREAALEKGDSWELEAHHKVNLGRPIGSGLGKFYLSFVATCDQDVFNFIRDHVRVGDAVRIERTDKLIKAPSAKWWVYVNDRLVGKTAAYNRDRGTGINGFTGFSAVTGFVVTSIVVQTYQDTLLYDQRNPPADFSRSWKSHAIETGYTYIVDFAGYGKPV